MTLAERLRKAVVSADRHDLNLLIGDGHAPDEVMDDDGVAASVLIAVTDRPDPGVILTQRTETLRRHAGQVAFPGGRADPEDVDVVDTALREAEEEIGLPRSAVTIIGVTDPYRTGTGYAITPVVGIIAPDLVLVPQESEVAAVFEVPLSFALDPANQVAASMEWRGHERHFYEIQWQDRRIWGATAAMIVNLSRRLQWTK